MQPTHCNIKNIAGFTLQYWRPVWHYQGHQILPAIFNSFCYYFTHFLDYTHEIPATTSSTRLQYSNEPQLTLSIVLSNLSVMNHNIGVLRRDNNFIFFLFRFRHFPFPFIFLILLLSKLDLLPFNTPALFHLLFF